MIIAALAIKDDQNYIKNVKYDASLKINNPYKYSFDEDIKKQDISGEPKCLDYKNNIAIPPPKTIKKIFTAFVYGLMHIFALYILAFNK